MALINEIIPRQGFEIVRDMIGAILKLELENQKSLQPAVLTEDINVYSERSTPVENAEELTINVLLSSANYSGMTQKDTMGRTIYFIDIYASASADHEERGDLRSAKRLHKYLGLCRSIFQYSEYKTLSLTPGSIGGTSVDDFGVADPDLTRNNSDFIRMARITFSVRIQENQGLIKGDPFTGNLSQIRLDETEKGYKYEIQT